ncbi:putative Ran-interacting protein Mog1 [Aspergillus bombycis]|uniref:Putative Ran-interacting protein Mog1 n=1 Tax=Aspergillus bombycis TaxID=109264 RepID=A0A1F8AB11_9EURO|nr:putative Ran-interacting protein Mog1 [Aspergillus bombycis]OGM48900.1 putative Ran-interacting protein Mog1 [Aspergillus bombycis]
MTTYTPRDFYGGAIKGPVPQNWVDAREREKKNSDVREIPSHQEVYLSPTTLTSQITEINQRVTEPETLSLDTLIPDLQTHQHQQQLDADAKAALYHVHDLCDEDDKLEIVTPPARVILGKFPAGTVAYRGVVRVTSPKGRRGPGSGSGVGIGGAVAGSSLEGGLTSTVTLWYLVVRLVEQETDLVVFVNVPREEFEKAGDLRGLEVEERLADGLITAFVEGLEVVDWDLFC